MLEWIQVLDQKGIIYLNNLGTPAQDIFWSNATKITLWIPLYIYFGYLIFKFYSKSEAVRIANTIFLALATTLLFTDVTKEFVVRDRPINDVTIGGMLRLIIQPTDYSFFSGHACNGFTIATLMYLFLRTKTKYAWMVFLWAILFSYSRLYLGVHYPSDVLVGAVVGVVIAYGFYRLHDIYIEYMKGK
ncbi:phosphatase PAP2 family protein [Imtechella halotolerans]|uniref:PAP2 superfamily protein n=1 Tax=Imtechella halotolerans K1 TaxID=946077 RepID=I0WH72_9FLAO|nr:phosphatase PAP2 family protein [Imtechella halotolerans]EID75738.1 PAP2 superfamily protein [Imtechella halotolerans K1]WMQ63434.1 phosphatase PAP2 family protein [Imtechella halotolerans]